MCAPFSSTKVAPSYLVLFISMKKDSNRSYCLSCRRWVIFPGRRQPSIVTVSELNYCVRDGNRCTLATINTYLLSCVQESKQRKLYLRFALFLHTTLQLLNYNISLSFCQDFFGDPWGNRTPVCGVRGRRLDRLTNGPHLVFTQLQRSSLCYTGIFFFAFFFLFIKEKRKWCTIGDSNPGPTD